MIMGTTLSPGEWAVLRVYRRLNGNVLDVSALQGAVNFDITDDNLGDVLATLKRKGVLEGPRGTLQSYALGPLGQSLVAQIEMRAARHND
jgi:hypothetical protein